MKKVIIGFCVTLAALASQANYLWWQVDGSENGMGDIAYYIKEELNLSSDDVAARVVAVDENGHVQGTSATAGFIDEWYTAPNQTVDLSSFGDGYTGYSYYVEIVKASDSSYIAKNKEAQQYNSLSGSITETLSDLPSVQTVWHGGGAGGYAAAPEPTSAVLLLLGVAGLALRRKQRKQE